MTDQRLIEARKALSRYEDRNSRPNPAHLADALRGLIDLAEAERIAELDARQAAYRQDCTDWYVDHEHEPEITTNAFFRGWDAAVGGGRFSVVQGEPSEHRDRIALAEFIERALDGDAGFGVGESLAGGILSFLSERAALSGGKATACETPTTEGVRAAYIGEPKHWLDERVGAEFDSWLAAVRAEAWDDGFADRHGLPNHRTFLGDRFARNPHRVPWKQEDEKKERP